MSVIVRAYRPDEDYSRVDRFLVESYLPGDRLHVWLQPRWEYMFSHPNVDEIDLTSFGVAEEGGDIVGVIHAEHSPAFVYPQIRPGCDHVAPDLLGWAEQHLGGWWSRSFERELLGIYTDHPAMESLLKERGYQRWYEREAHGQISLAAPLPETPLPDGYRVYSLADNNDLAEVNRVLWRGFGHEGPPPDEEIPSRRRAQSTPNYAHDLNVVTVDPDGHFAAFSGIWVEPTHRVAYVEPVATDPDHRRLGLGRAVVTECLRRARDRGATLAWVGSEQEFYTALGFEVTCASHLWSQEPEPAHTPS